MRCAPRSPPGVGVRADRGETLQLNSILMGVRTMAAKSNATPVARILTVAGQVIPAEYLEIPLEKVTLSAANPRIHRLLRRNPAPTPEDIQKFLLDEDGVADLQRQIRDNRGLVDPIIVDHNYQVIEGNCRTAIYMKLRVGQTNDPTWTKIPAFVLSQDITERQVLILQAIYHVHSNKIKWGAYEQQEHLQQMRKKLKMEPAEIARVLGLSVKSVNTLLETYESVTKYYMAKAKPGEERKLWSHFHEFHKNPKLAAFRKSEENVKTFAKLVGDGTIKKGADVRKLPAIVANPKALQKLVKQGFAAAVGEVGKGDPSKVYPVFKRMRSMTKLLHALKSKDIEELKTQPAEQNEIRALYQALVDVAKAANVKLPS
jgi:hypothetical protein